MRIITPLYLNVGRYVTLYANGGWDLKRKRLINDCWKNAVSDVAHTVEGFHVSLLHIEIEVL
jgi:hypothetical protein